MSTRTYGPRTAAPATPKPNRFGGKCRKPGCGVWVVAEAGVLVGSRAAGWGVEHNAGACPTTGADAKPVANAEPGYYVRADGTAIVVVVSKRDKARTYGKALRFPADGSRPSWNYEPGLGISVADLRPMTAADAAEMGLSHGFCIKCCAPLGGETLSAAVSALIGYGETCAKNLGWFYPTGVKAQRAYLDSHGR
jgi:hypothetical protein